MDNTTTPRKRKSETSAVAGTLKKARISDAKALVDTILAAPDSYSLPEDDDAIRQMLVKVANYARSLEGPPPAAGQQKKTPEELAVAAEKIRSAATLPEVYLC